MGTPPTIRTPDQRLRVFVSSTLQELAVERTAARKAIERLRLAPHRANPYPLHGTPIAHEDPTEPVAQTDWEVLQ